MSSIQLKLSDICEHFAKNFNQDVNEVMKVMMKLPINQKKIENFEIKSWNEYGDELNSFSIKQLKEIMKENNIKGNGKKSELVEKIRNGPIIKKDYSPNLSDYDNIDQLKSLSIKEFGMFCKANEIKHSLSKKNDIAEFIWNYKKEDVDFEVNHFESKEILSEQNMETLKELCKLYNVNSFTKNDMIDELWKKYKEDTE